MQSYNPDAARYIGLGYSHFARHYSGNHYCFLFLPVLRCFSSRGWLSLRSNTPSVYWVVPFGNLRIYHSCAVPRSLSQLTTSFIASQTLGIHHAPLFALKNFSPYVLHITYSTILVFDFAFPICQRAKMHFNQPKPICYILSKC